MRSQFYPLFISFLILSLYYPSIFSENLSIDDYGMISGLINKDRLNIQQLFFPSSGLYYYRPLLILSFWSDYFFFGSQPVIAHFINILLHLVNTLLLFKLLQHMVSEKESPWPLLLAIFFGIHPLVTEPVNWISGRTDILAGLFVLLSFLLFTRKGPNLFTNNLLAAFCYLCGLWSKEVAIGLLPIVFWMSFRDHQIIQASWASVVGRLLPFVIVTLVYFLMRTGGVCLDSGVYTALHGGHGAELFTLTSKTQSLIKAIGFYSHKVLWPFPLNFAIIDINRPLAWLFGIVALVGLAVVVFRYTLRSFSLGLIWFFSFLAPALPVAVNRMAWTPLAERYLYLPLMGLCLLLVYGLAASPRKRRTQVILLMGFILFPWGIATAQRNLVWQKNLTLWQDVVKKSPNCTGGHNELALALMREGRKEEAKKHLQIAALLAKKGKDSDRVLGNLALQEKNIEQKVQALEKILSNSTATENKVPILSQMVRVINNELAHGQMDQEMELIWLEKLLKCHQQLAVLAPNPYHLYRIGQLQLALGNTAAALDAFSQTCRNSHDYYTQPACTLAKRLEQAQLKE